MMDAASTVWLLGDRNGFLRHIVTRQPLNSQSDEALRWDTIKIVQRESCTVTGL